MKRLKPLQEYLAKPERQGRQSPDEMLAAFEAFKAEGAPMTIRKVD